VYLILEMKVSCKEERRKEVCRVWCEIFGGSDHSFLSGIFYRVVLAIVFELVSKFLLDVKEDHFPRPNAFPP